MRAPFNLLFMILMVSLIGCEKKGDNPEVETYINQLKSNSYTSPELPAFQPSDIPALLQYRNETMVIQIFPIMGFHLFGGLNVNLECMFYGLLNQFAQ